MEENKNEKRQHHVVLECLTQIEFDRLRQQAQKRWEFKGKPGVASIPFMLDILPGEMSLMTFRKMLPGGKGVSARILQETRKAIVPPSAASTVSPSTASSGHLYGLLAGALRKEDFIVLIDSLPYNLASSQALRDMMPHSPIKPSLFRWCGEVILERWEENPALAGMLANQLFHNTKLWEIDAKQLGHLNDLCNKCLSKNDERGVVVVEPLALFLDSKDNIKVHQAHLREVINSHGWRNADAQRVQDYYQLRASQVVAIRHHAQNRSDGLQAVSDIGRLIHLISSVCATDDAQDSTSRGSHRAMGGFDILELEIMDYANLASQMIRGLKRRGQKELADDALRVLLLELKSSPYGKSVGLRVFGRTI